MVHHAYLLVGSSLWAQAFLNLSERKDVTLREYESMTIADVRALVQDALRKPLQETTTFVICAHTILNEAQNALLKLVEEPNAHTQFYFVLSSEDILLPTLRSRLHVLDKEKIVVREEVFSTFLLLNPAERITLITEKIKAEDEEWVQDIVKGYELFAHTSNDPMHIQDALMIGMYMTAVGSSKKMLLEHIALTI